MRKTIAARCVVRDVFRGESRHIEHVLFHMQPPIMQLSIRREASRTAGASLGMASSRG